VLAPLVLGGAVIAGIAANELFFRTLRGAGWIVGHDLSEALARRCWWPGRLVAGSGAAALMLPVLHVAPSVGDLLQQVLNLTLIVSAGWMIVAIVQAIEDVAKGRYRVDVPDNLQSRRVHTRITVIRRITIAVVSVLVFALALTTFGTARALGASILASAGIIGVIVGIAARPTITNLVAGLQIFFTEPVRIDDVVVVEGQWGRIEEITLVYVAVRLWDDRRLILPIVEFVEKPFENWTRHSANLLVTVFMAVDFMIPVEAVRDELGKIFERSKLWDRRFWNLQVTDMTPDSVQLRVLMTAPDASTAWDLRCEVRERLLEYLQLRHPHSLPRRRVQLASGPDSAAGPTDSRPSGVAVGGQPLT
jgi:small-conductance mechanosensitive channel